LFTYSANVVTLSKPNQENKQQNILNLCLLLLYIIVRRVYSVLGSYTTYIGDPPIRVELRSLLHASYRQQTRFFQSDQTSFLKANKPFFLKRQTVFLKTKQTAFVKANQSAFVKANQSAFVKANNPPF
jgi:hypothetical protein